MNVHFGSHAWADYLYWQETDKKMLRAINKLIKDCQRNPYSGLGKPEPLRFELTGFWSRRINDEHRLVYAVRDDGLFIFMCRDHYKKS